MPPRRIRHQSSFREETRGRLCHALAVLLGVGACAVGCQHSTVLTGDEGDRGADADALLDESAPRDVDGVDTTHIDETSLDLVSDDTTDTSDIPMPPTCGDHMVQEGEECDNGPANSDTRADACRTTCRPPSCGDGVVDTGETCDDGNRVEGDGCPASCFPRGEPPVEVVGSPVPADDTLDVGGPPDVVWNGEGWGIVWGGRGPVHFLRVDANLRVLGGIVTLPISGPASIGRGPDAYAVASSSPSESEVAVVILDDAGATTAGPTWLADPGEQLDTVYSESIDQWFVAYSTRTAGGPLGGQVVLASVDEHGLATDGPIEVSLADGTLAPRVVPLPRGRVAVAWSREDAVLYRAYQWPAPEPLGLPFPAASCSGALGCGVAGAMYYDRAILATASSDDVSIVAIDSVAGTAVAGPTVVGHPGVTTAVDIVAVPERGLLGLCYWSGPGPAGCMPGQPETVIVRVVRPDGTPMGEEVAVASDLACVGGCAIGWSGTEFVVAFWKAGSDSVGNQILVQRVAPLI
jgi:cysteine-rich repeat protein